MTNPWVDLGDGPEYVLSNDKAYIAAFNHSVETKGDHWINLWHTPEPRLGPINAPVVILQLNPSYDRTEEKAPENPDRVKLNLTSIKDEDYPHLGVLEETDKWWGPRLRELKKEVKKEKLARSICSIEFFPYRSRRFSHGAIRLPSQAYTFDLVRAALKRKALILITRNLRLWTSAIPELRDQTGKTVFSLRNPRSTFFTKRALPPRVYEAMLKQIDKS